MACLADADPLLDLQSVRALSGVLVARRQCVGVFGGKSSGISGACRRFCGWARLEASLRFGFGDCRHTSGTMNIRMSMRTLKTHSPMQILFCWILGAKKGLSAHMGGGFF